MDIGKEGLLLQAMLDQFARYLLVYYITLLKVQKTFPNRCRKVEITFWGFWICGLFFVPMAPPYLSEFFFGPAHLTFSIQTCQDMQSLKAKYQ